MHTTPDALALPERAKIIDFLRNHPVGVLSLVDTKGDPHTSTIYFSVNDELGITFTTKKDTYKYGNIKHHNTVMLVVFDAATQTAVQVTGKAKEVTDYEQQQDIYHGTLNAAKQTGEDVVPPIAKIPAGPYVGFYITIEDISLSEYGWGNNFSNAMQHAQDQSDTSDPA